MAVALINLERGKVLVASVYLDYNKPVVQPWLQKFMDFADTKQYPILLGIDSNAHSQLYGPDSNDRGDIFEDFILQHNFKVENIGEKHTFHAFRGNAGIGSCIDVTLTRGLLPVSDWHVRDMEFNGSDHHTISWSIPLTIPKPVKIRPWHSAKWDEFKAKVAEHTFEYPVNFTTRKIDKFLQRFNKVIYDALDIACPLRDVKASPVEIKWFGKDQKRLLNRTKRKFVAYRRNTTVAKKKALARARRIYMRSCRRAKKESWRKFVEETPDIQSMTKLVRIAQKKSLQTISTLRKPDNSLSEPGADTIEVLTSAHFPAATVGAVDMQHTNQHKFQTQEIREAFKDWINPTLVKRAFKRFLPYKAAGPDNLKPIVYKHLPDNAIEALTVLYQACIALKHTPMTWRETKVIFLPKPGKPAYDIPKAYRPISLSNFALKALERLVVWKMDKDLTDVPLHDKQHGFTKGKSTESAISNTVDYIEQQILDKAHCLGLFLDISSAFDSISIDHIKRQLLEHNGDPDLVEWYYQYLSRRYLDVNLHGDSVKLTTGTGFPQGGVCSARFWLIAFDPAIQIINTRGIVGNGYADDCSALIGGTHTDNMIESMQAMLDELVTWGRSCGLRFNPQKTVAIMFTKSTRQFRREVRMDNASIPYSNSVVYLGVTLDKTLSWLPHVQTKIKRVKAFIAFVASITRAYWGPKPKLLKWAYTGMARPIVSYAAMIWGSKAEEENVSDALRQINRAAMNTIVRVPRSTPTRAMELILDIYPLHLHIIKEGMASALRLKAQTPLHWEGISHIYPEIVSHLRFWEYMSQDLGVTTVDLDSDLCCTLAPTRQFILDLDSFVNMADCQGQVAFNVYTDGSKLEGQVGAGVYINKEGKILKTEKYRLPDEATVFQAEVMAIREAARILITIPDISHVKFFVDSQAALRALHNVMITSKLVLQTVHMLNQIHAQSIVFVWTKAHIGNFGNETADRLAKAGTKLTQIMDIPLPADSMKDTLIQGIRKRWDEEWSAHPKCRQSKLFQPAQDAEKASAVIQWPRLKLGRYIRAITGHNNLLYHLHNMYNFISPICRFCNDSYEEFYHLAYTCPALWCERQQINSMEEDHFNDWTHEQIIEFVLLPKLDEAFVRPLYWVEDERELLEVPSQSQYNPRRHRNAGSSASSASSPSSNNASCSDLSSITQDSLAHSSFLDSE